MILFIRIKEKIISPIFRLNICTYLNKKDMILGVCKWFSEITGAKVKFIRLLFIIGFFFFGFSLLMYLGLWILKLVLR